MLRYLLFAAAVFYFMGCKSTQSCSAKEAELIQTGILLDVSRGCQECVTNAGLDALNECKWPCTNPQGPECGDCMIRAANDKLTACFGENDYVL